MNEQKPPTGPRAPATKVAPARVAAAHVLLAVERGVAHSDDQLRTPRIETLSRQDRDLTTELVRGTLRWQIVLDGVIADRLAHPDSDMHFGVIIALRMAAYQLLFLDRIPSHAAVNDSVELAKEADGMQAAGLVNAVLRRLLRERAVLGNLRDDAVAAYPKWLVDRWRARFGDAAMRSICAFGQQPPPTSIRITGALDDSLAGLDPGAFLTQSRQVLSGDPAAIASARIQDEASQLVGEIAALHAGAAILDTCAAPGGKTAILAERNPESELTAVDVSSARLRIMQRRLPWSTHVHFTSTDASNLPTDVQYSGILCDVPCSGTGTLARNPEIRHRVNEAALQRHADRQRAILVSALKALKPGGRLVYSTCSLESEENEQVVDAVRAEMKDISLAEMKPVLEELATSGVLTQGGRERLETTALAGPYLRTTPGVHPCDGFFAAVLTKK